MRDPVAPSDLCAAYLTPLVAWLEHTFRHEADCHQRQDAAHRAILDYLKKPQGYDPERSDLAAYLRLAARRDLLNLWRGEQRHHRQRAPWSVVELGQEAGKYLTEDDDPADALARQEHQERQRARLRELTAAFTEAEQRVLDLMLQGERAHTVFAAALRLGHLESAQQVEEVKRVRDRIKRRLERGAAKHA
jgi:hypothetical protein